LLEGEQYIGAEQHRVWDCVSDESVWACKPPDDVRDTISY